MRKSPGHVDVPSVAQQVVAQKARLAGKSNDIRVEIRLTETSQPIIFNAAHNTYEKGPFYCVFVKSNEGQIRNEGVVYKCPIDHIFNVKESY
jgi:hypothetical protein